MGSFVFVSGFGLFLNPNNRHLNSPKKILNFLKKRYIRIFPLYWIALALFLIQISNTYPTGDIYIGFLDINPAYLIYHFFGLQIIVAPYFGPPILTLWFIGIIVIYYLIYIVLNLIKSVKWTIPMAIGVFFLFVGLNGIFGLVEIRFFLYYSLFIVGIITAQIYTSPLYKRIKERLRNIPKALLLLIPLAISILGLVGFQLLTEFTYSTFISEYGTYNLDFISYLNPNFIQLIGVLFLINLIILVFLIFAISLFNFIFRTFRLIFPKRKGEKAVSLVAYSTYGAYLFHRVFLAIFVAILTSLSLNMQRSENLYIVILFVPFIFLFSYFIQDAIDRLWKLISRRTATYPSLESEPSIT